MSRVRDRNGVQLTRGMRVLQRLGDSRDVREGVVVATVSPSSVLVRWGDDQDDETVDAARVTTVSAVSERRRRP